MIENGSIVCRSYYRLTGEVTKSDQRQAGFKGATAQRKNLTPQVKQQKSADCEPAAAPAALARESKKEIVGQAF
jgi:hypothetical protein